MKKSYYLLALLAFCILAGYSQTAEKKWNIGVYGGKSEYNGDIGNGFFSVDEAFYAFGALSVSHYLSPRFNLGVYGSYGEHGFWVDYDYENNFRAKKLYADLQLQFKFVRKDDALFRPYIFTGVGFRNLSDYTSNEGSDFVIPAGIGLDLKIYKNLSIRYVGSFGYTFDDNRDFDESKNGNDMQLEHSLGLTFNLGSAKDTDGDGVPDRRDQCPGTPEGALVDEQGCIIDRDKDGFADNLDDCPDQYGIAQFRGCPDTDQDGIVDNEDECPDRAGTVEFKGCPDTDGDGIEDRYDDCPTVAGLASLRGCPDTDGDGLTDFQDKCPTVAGPAVLLGCPDRDGDGIIDIEDKCPDVAGIAENKGCPEIKEETRQLFEQALQGIQFETGKDVIRKTSYPILNQVVDVMMENPEYLLSIYGHTDSKGDEQMNQDLSQRRAGSVKKYLQDMGVPEKRIVESKGFGETMPVATNDTSEGRAKNRRVEFKVAF